MVSYYREESKIPSSPPPLPSRSVAWLPRRILIISVCVRACVYSFLLNAFPSSESAPRNAEIIHILVPCRESGCLALLYQQHRLFSVESKYYCAYIRWIKKTDEAERWRNLSQDSQFSDWNSKTPVPLSQPARGAQTEYRIQIQKHAVGISFWLRLPDCFRGCAQNLHVNSLITLQ